MRKKKYNSEQIIQIIRENINEGISVPRLAERYNIHHGTIEEWIIQYKQNGAATFSLEKHNRVYSEEKKNEAVKEYFPVTAVVYLPCCDVLCQMVHVLCQMVQ